MLEPEPSSTGSGLPRPHPPASIGARASDQLATMPISPAPCPSPIASHRTRRARGILDLTTSRGDRPLGPGPLFDVVSSPDKYLPCRCRPAALCFGPEGNHTCVHHCSWICRSWSWASLCKNLAASRLARRAFDTPRAADGPSPRTASRRASVADVAARADIVSSVAREPQVVPSASAPTAHRAPRRRPQLVDEHGVSRSPATRRVRATRGVPFADTPCPDRAGAGTHAVDHGARSRRVRAPPSLPRLHAARSRIAARGAGAAVK